MRAHVGSGETVRYGKNSVFKREFRNFSAVKRYGSDFGYVGVFRSDRKLCRASDDCRIVRVAVRTDVSDGYSFHAVYRVKRFGNVCSETKKSADGFNGYFNVFKGVCLSRVVVPVAATEQRICFSVRVNFDVSVNRRMAHKRGYYSALGKVGIGFAAYYVYPDVFDYGLSYSAGENRSAVSIAVCVYGEILYNRAFANKTYKTSRVNDTRYRMSRPVERAAEAVKPVHVLPVFVVAVIVFRFGIADIRS